MKKSTQEGGVVTKAVDPVCGMAVATDSDFFSYYNGETYYFCSAEDKKEFDRHPDDYFLKEKLGPEVGGKGY